MLAKCLFVHKPFLAARKPGKAARRPPARGSARFPGEGATVGKTRAYLLWITCGLYVDKAVDKSAYPLAAGAGKPFENAAARGLFKAALICYNNKEFK